jgi:hypothetical protein
MSWSLQNPSHLFLVSLYYRAASAQYTNLLRYSMYAIGLAILLITSLPPLLKQGSGLPGLVIALMIISLGVGGVKSTLPPFLGQSNRYTHLSHILVQLLNHSDTQRSNAKRARPESGYLRQESESLSTVKRPSSMLSTFTIGKNS